MQRANQNADGLVKNVLWVMLSVVAGALLGLAATYYTVVQPPNFGVVTAGVWITRPGIGANNADPYSKALIAARGEIPTSAAEGLTLTAERDSEGRRLLLGCTYRLEGVMPAAAFWTLTLYTPDGGSPSEVRHAFTSAEALTDENGVVVVMLSPQPQPGNWVPLRGHGRFLLYLRLYETQISSTTQALDRGTTPGITRGSCP